MNVQRHISRAWISSSTRLCQDWGIFSYPTFHHNPYPAISISRHIVLVQPSNMSSQGVYDIWLPFILNQLHNRRYRIGPEHNHCHDGEVPVKQPRQLLCPFSSQTSLVHEDSHHRTPTYFLPLRTPINLSCTHCPGTCSTHRSIRSELLRHRSVDLGSCEC